MRDACQFIKEDADTTLSLPGFICNKNSIAWHKCMAFGCLCVKREEGGGEMSRRENLEQSSGKNMAVSPRPSVCLALFHSHQQTHTPVFKPTYNTVYMQPVLLPNSSHINVFSLPLVSHRDGT